MFKTLKRGLEPHNLLTPLEQQFRQIRRDLEGTEKFSDAAKEESARLFEDQREAIRGR